TSCAALPDLRKDMGAHLAQLRLAGGVGARIGHWRQKKYVYFAVGYEQRSSSQDNKSSQPSIKSWSLRNDTLYLRA
ncbi:MAG: hypothetical protein ACRYG8_27260, partial [Janthinobacterium lividum]